MNFFTKLNTKTISLLFKENWRSGITIAFISVPLSIALSIASGAGPIPGLITGIWATLIASLFGGSNYNVVGAAGALTTVLFAATLVAPLGLGAQVLPLLALATGLIILFVWLLNAGRYLYYIPSSVMYGFSAGVAFLIAASQLFDATGLSKLARTGTFHGDIEKFIAHANTVHTPTVIAFTAFLAFILIWKRYIKKLPAVIPVAIIGIIVGYLEATFFSVDLISLGDKFGSFTGVLAVAVPWGSYFMVFSNPELLLWVLKAAGVIALIAVLETLITAKIGDKLTKTQSSSRKELLGLALANLGSGAMGGLPATGVFIRTGANIKAGATHKMSATIAAVATAGITLVVLPFFTFIPMAAIAAILVNTAIGLIETDKFKEFWMYEKSSFVIALIVVAVTIFEDAGLAVVVGAVLSLVWFADRVSHGRFDAIFNFKDGKKVEERGNKVLSIPEGEVSVLTYSIAGFLGYIDSAQHAANLRSVAHASNIESVIIRLRDLFTLDFEGQEMIVEAVEELERKGKKVYFSSANPNMRARLASIPALAKETAFFDKTGDALKSLTNHHTS